MLGYGFLEHAALVHLVLGTQFRFRGWRRRSISIVKLVIERVWMRFEAVGGAGRPGGGSELGEGKIGIGGLEGSGVLGVGVSR